MRSIAIPIILFIFLSVIAPAVRAQNIENLEIFGDVPSAQETDKDRSLAKCLSGMRQFFSALVGFEDFSDYWRDIYIGLRFPLYYSDIANVENQLNKARYAVVASFLRCDQSRLKSSTDSYYRLEAELYFVRHFIDIDGGTIFNRVNSADRRNFSEEMQNYFLLRKFDGDADKTRALFEGYFDLFAAQYAARAASYAGFGDDPIWSELSAKVDKLIATFKSSSELGKEFGALGSDVKEIAVEVGSSTKDKFVSFTNAPGKSIQDAAKDIVRRFQVCPSAGHPDDCKSLLDVIDYVGKAFSNTDVTNSSQNNYPKTILIPKKSKEKSEKKITYDEVKERLEKIKNIVDESALKAEMLASYEVLYGRATGDGVKEVMKKMDNLLQILGDSEKGSIGPINQVAQCAEEVQGNVCQ